MNLSNHMSNRNSTPEGPTQPLGNSSSSGSSLRPPSSRSGAGHSLRQSADMSSYNSPLSSRIRPSSEVYLGSNGNNNNQQTNNNNQTSSAETEALDKAAQKWLADLDQYELTLEDMAAATLDQDFKDELSAIEQWFRVLSEAERTAALYALLQQTTQVQIRFFITILQQMSRSHPMSAMLSPMAFEKDAMSNRMSDAMSQLALDAPPSRQSYPQHHSSHSHARVPPSPTVPSSQRNSQLDPGTIHAMFPDAAQAIANQRAKITGQPVPPPPPITNRNSALLSENRPSSLSINPSLSTTKEGGAIGDPPRSPWRLGEDRPKSRGDSTGPMGNWVPPPPTSASSGGLRSPGLPRPQTQSSLSASNIQQTTVTAPNQGLDMELSPYAGQSTNWASMVNTPVAGMFPNSANNLGGGGMGNSGSPGMSADMLANATAMKLAAMSTVNNRIILDSDVRKFRRRPPGEGMGAGMSGALGASGSPFGGPQLGLAAAQNAQQRNAANAAQGMSPTNILMFDEHGRPVPLSAAATAAALQVQAQQQQQQRSGLGLGHDQRRSRPNSPGLAFQQPNWGSLGGFTSPQNNGFLSADYASPGHHPALLPGGFGSIGAFGGNPGGDGYISDHSDMNPRGRSPRGRRGSSKPPEDPTDPTLLGDIGAWLRSLRLHKYTDNLKDLQWTQLVQLSDEDLEKRGVNALGARRKMLKVFEQVREAQAEGKL